MFWLGKSITPRISKEKIKLSPLEYIILAHLRSRELKNLEKKPVGQYGYELMKELNILFEGSWEAKSGTIYPLLSKLENTKGVLIGQKKKSPLGPKKKVYILSDEGRKLIDQIIIENYDNDLAFIKNYAGLLGVFKKTYEEDADALALEDPIPNCLNCGAELQPEAKFCFKCGKSISAMSKM